MDSDEQERLKRAIIGIAKSFDKKKPRRKCKDGHRWVKVTGYYTHACTICNEKKREIKHPWGVDQKATVKKCPQCGLRMRTSNHQCPIRKEPKR